MDKPAEMTVDEAAEFLGVTPTTIHNMAKRGDLKKHYRKYGKQRVFFLRSELEQLKETDVEEKPKRKK